ncbi:hypothetical protein [Cupriavidus sp. HMR-1]|uniref:hypothetical protein n=1 Tax=Cupriavidus sp. HMR-1 TaxID=1249621 RepID=UPI0012670C1D|nr:hypothetical protein [Cupriavidus sp. HMR-1]
MKNQANQYAELHDAELVSVAHEKKDKKISLGLVCSDGSEVSMKLCGVKTIRITDYVSQNIVSRVLHSESMQLDRVALNQLVTWANSLSDGTCLISREAADAYVSDIQTGALRLFAIEPSWGAELVCIYTAEER